MNKISLNMQYIFKDHIEIQLHFLVFITGYGSINKYNKIK